MAATHAVSGTYRAPDGTLVHRRPLPGGSLTLELDRLDAAKAPHIGIDDLVLLSEDPDWPDLATYRSVGLGSDET